MVIETTGLADPAPILYTLGADPELDDALRLARVVTTVDAVTGAATLDRFAEAARQVAVADLLLVTKTDLAEPGADLLARLDALNADAPRAHAPSTDDPGDILFGSGAPPRHAGAPLSEPNAAHHHDIVAHTIVLERAASRLEFARALGGLAREHGEDLLRVKGLVGFADRPDRPAVIQGAQHAIAQPVWLERWPESERCSWLVFIVQAIPLEAILKAFAFAGARPLGPRVPLHVPHSTA
jgi:G3E family GTPase